MLSNFVHLRRNIALSVFLLLLSSVSCEREKYEVVPYSYVNIYLQVSTDLANWGQGIAAYIPRDDVGVNGIILYRDMDDVYGNPQFFAYDGTCTYQPLDENCKILLEEFETVGTCPCCSSSFIVSADAVPTSGSKARLPLKQYGATLSNAGQTLHIHN